MHRLLLAIIALIILLACGSVATAQPIAPIEQTVVYRIDSNTARSHVKLTYANETGATAQEDAVTPWKKTFQAGPGQFLYVSAQLDDDASRHVTCSIMAGGKVLESAESKGRYVIATCKGEVGR